MFFNTVLKIILVFIIATILQVLFFRFVNPPASAYMISLESANLYSLFTTSNLSKSWVSSREISSNVKLAVISAEDQRFKDHFGFDLKQIENAVNEINKGKRVRGASTITQQVAKNLFLTHGKNFVRKGIEAYYTLLIELLWSKKRILEVYLNIAEMGNMIFGIESASRRYFKKSAERLNSYEAALIAAILPDPLKRNIVKPSKYLSERVSQIQDQMKNMGGADIVKDL
ncbi:MAG: monofunctional biosynthetic peptidoglycan transglycosylase [Melioribacteraceae bacterium]|nr:monofunctional biosynthetic peptidoglycan transglycosylase [Melioribacteraceae bacterium]